MEFLWQGLLSITWQQAVMYVVGALLIYLAVEKGFEPALLLGMVLAAQLIGWLQKKSGVTLQTVSPEAKTAKVLHPVLPIGFVVAVLGALLLFQTYFIGPITWVIKEIPA
jgi:oxaloacetate decarboxylase beta subunit